MRSTTRVMGPTFSLLSALLLAAPVGWLGFQLGLAGCAEEAAKSGVLPNDGASAGQQIVKVASVNAELSVELDNGAALFVPKGAVNGSLEVGLARPKEAHARELVEPLVKSDARLLSAPHVLTPHGAKFQADVDVTLPAAKLKAGERVVVAYLNDEQDTTWKKIANVQVEQDNQVTFKMAHFSVVVLVADEQGLSDTAVPEGGLESFIRCGTQACVGGATVVTAIGPCCATENTCGFNALDLNRSNGYDTFSGCVPKEFPPAVRTSAHCGAFFDQFEADVAADATANAQLHSNGGYDLKVNNEVYTFDGCCLASGECGAYLSQQRAPATQAVFLPFGCVSVTRLKKEFQLGLNRMPSLSPSCNPVTGDSAL